VFPDKSSACAQLKVTPAQDGHDLGRAPFGYVNALMRNELPHCRADLDLESQDFPALTQREYVHILAPMKPRDREPFISKHKMCSGMYMHRLMTRHYGRWLYRQAARSFRSGPHLLSLLYPIPIPTLSPRLFYVPSVSAAGPTIYRTLSSPALVSRVATRST